MYMALNTHLCTFCTKCCLQFVLIYRTARALPASPFRRCGNELNLNCACALGPNQYTFFFFCRQLNAVFNKHRSTQTAPSNCRITEQMKREWNHSGALLGDFTNGSGNLSTNTDLFESVADSLIFTNHQWRPFSAGSPKCLRVCHLRKRVRCA